jgi:small subunit ribosomal protein S18
VMRQRSTKDRPTKGTRPRYTPARKVCSFCKNKVEVIDYKDHQKLLSYISDRGKIEPRRRTGTCARHQRLLATAIKRARHLALLPFVSAHIQKTGGVGAR